MQGEGTKHLISTIATFPSYNYDSILSSRVLQYGVLPHRVVMPHMQL